MAGPTLAPKELPVAMSLRIKPARLEGFQLLTIAKKHMKCGRRIRNKWSAKCCNCIAAMLALLSEFCLANPALPGGLSSTPRHDYGAFAQISANMPSSRRLEFSVGESFFRNPWVPAPSSTDARDGLGPLFNTNACQNCHSKNGRGTPPAPGDDPVALIVRISIPSNSQTTAHLGVQTEPTYGTQLQNRAIPGVAPVAKLRITYMQIPYTYPDGSVVNLRKPELHISDLAYGPLHAQTQFSLRLAPPMIGLGLLAAVNETTLAALEDPDDRNHDGISGRRNRVWDASTQRFTTGRFGWKAGAPNLAGQNASAFANDLGIANSIVKPTCPDSALAKPCRDAPNGGEPELAPLLAERVNFYTANLAVPKARPLNRETIAAGEALFNQLKCASCHVPELTTGDIKDMPWLARQTIHPYTDLLLHDMGEGLADHREEFAASGSEWRTPALWAIGLAQVVNPAAGFLHDGRAESLEAAILWHDGEAAASRLAFVQLEAVQRQQLLEYLEHL